MSEGLQREELPPEAPRPNLVQLEQLLSDVRIYSPLDDQGLSDRLQLTGGTRPAGPGADHRGRHQHAGGWHREARVPEGSTRAVTQDELQRLRTPCEGWERCRDVALLPADRRILFAVDSAIRSGEAPRPDSPSWRAVVAQVQASLSGLKRPSTVMTGIRCRVPDVDALTLYRAPARQATVTCLARGQRDAYWVGLHIDSWEGTSMLQRRHIRNRLCVNLSEHTRYLLFVNLTLDKMMELVGNPRQQDVAPVTLFSGHRFMRRFPRYPVVRLAIEPGEMYVAPTGRVVHDGQAPTAGDDLALHMLGHFALGSAAHVGVETGASGSPLGP